MNDARAGMHSGPWHDARENLTPSAASRSRAGVSTPASPAQPIMSLRCWSAMTTTMLGAFDINLVPPHSEHHPSHHPFDNERLPQVPGVPGRGGTGVVLPSWRHTNTWCVPGVTMGTNWSFTTRTAV